MGMSWLTPLKATGTLATSTLKRNIVANVVGGMWVVLLNLVVIPFQIRILGAEAYGLLGFAASLQIVFSILDFGLSVTVIREVASDISPGRLASCELIQTVATIYWLVALVLGLGLIFSADWLVHRWLVLESLSPQQAATAIRIMAGWVAFGWPVALYTSVLTGLQRLDVVNVLRILATTLNLGGGIIVLVVSGRLDLFLGWMGFSALVTVLLHMAMCKRLLPELTLEPGIFPGVIKRIWRFSLDMNLISILTVLYMQTDRLLISKLMPLSALGYYNTAYNVTKGINIVQGFFNSAVLPALASDYSRGEKQALQAHYEKYAQVLVYLIGLPSFALVFWGHDILQVWTTPEAANNSHRVLALLAVGFLLNAAMSAPYILSVATGYTRSLLKVNLMAVPFYFPALYLLIRRYGIEGAGLAWLLLNLYYLALFVPLVQRQLMGGGTVVWLGRNWLPFFGLGMLYWVGRYVALTLPANERLGMWSIFVVCALGYAGFGFLFLGRDIRESVWSFLRRLLTPTRASDS
jgi:O-antigen/teichoic acid export membrane protein